MKLKFLKIFLLIFIFFIFNMNFCYAENYKGKVTGTDVRLRGGPGTNYKIIKNLTKNKVYNMVSKDIYKDEGGCKNGWYKIYYENNNTGYVCSNYLDIIVEGEINVEEDEYYRPWTSPKKAIMGGAKFIASSYISKGQFTSYLKKFNVNPDGYHKVYNHQYMANLKAPYSEAYSSYKSYRDNDLLKLPLEFTIPVFDEMPDVTILPGSNASSACQSEIKDSDFEALLDKEGFPESYKCKLRIVHNDYPNWTFKAMHTNLNFKKSVYAEQAVSSIQGGDIYYDMSSGNKVQTESGWYLANYDTVAYYLDPRNFLVPERILMFEHLAYTDNYNESVLNSILKGTFMEDYSFLDNETYAHIFIEAGKNANVSAVYLASLARQESGVKGSKATTGNEFTYKGITYKGLFNFFNIGASSSAESPILAGLVWASGGSSSVIVPNTPDIPNNSDNNNNEHKGITEAEVLSSLSVSSKNNCLTGLSLGTTLSALKSKLASVTISVDGLSDGDTLKTGNVITISDNINTFTYTISISGDVDGDGVIGATDYVKIKNYIMEKSGSNLNIAQSIAADIDNNGEIGATDYVKIKNSIME